jgi:folylpolyglutamate synthase/dihydropteroate synthase
MNASKKNEIVLICGSFFIMADVRSFLKFNDEKDPDSLND